MSSTATARASQVQTPRTAGEESVGRSIPAPQAALILSYAYRSLLEEHRRLEAAHHDLMESARSTVVVEQAVSEHLLRRSMELERDMRRNGIYVDTDGTLIVPDRLYAAPKLSASASPAVSPAGSFLRPGGALQQKDLAAAAAAGSALTESAAFGVFAEDAAVFRLLDPLHLQCRLDEVTAQKDAALAELAKATRRIAELERQVDARSSHTAPQE